MTLRQAGMMASLITTRMHILGWTVSRVWKLFQETDETNKRDTPGCMRKTTARNECILKRLCTGKKFQSVATINHLWNEHTGMHTSIKITRQRMHAMGYYNRIARRKLMISVVNRTRRIRWCTIVRTWTQDHWSRIVFSDESRFNIGFNEGRICVWRQNGEAIDPGNIAQVRRQGSSSVMVWGCITYEGVGELVVVDGTSMMWATWKFWSKG